MADKVNVSKIVLNINDKSIELSLEEAEELNKILNGLFKEKVVEKYSYVPYYPYYPPYDYSKWRYVSWSSDHSGRDTGTVTFTCKSS